LAFLTNNDQHPLRQTTLHPIKRTDREHHSNHINFKNEKVCQITPSLKGLYRVSRVAKLLTKLLSNREANVPDVDDALIDIEDELVVDGALVEEFRQYLAPRLGSGVV